MAFNDYSDCGTIERRVPLSPVVLKKGWESIHSSFSYSCKFCFSVSNGIRIVKIMYELDCLLGSVLQIIKITDLGSLIVKD